MFSFSGTNGANPVAGLILREDGNFYGTTGAGGAATNANDFQGFGYGTVFRFTPDGTLTTLASFFKTNGAYPHEMIRGMDGNFYGITGGNRADSFGTIFRLTTTGQLTNLASFMGTNGVQPIGALVQASDGRLYGETTFGGADYYDTGGWGTVFAATTNGLITNLLSFSQAIGRHPYSGFAHGADGYLYGTTGEGGDYGGGTIFRISLGGSFTNLVSLGGTNGSRPQAALHLSADGYFYGTTSFYTEHGTVFRFNTNGTLTQLAAFNGTNGDSPSSELMEGPDGFYGTTAQGGPYTNELGRTLGTIFKVSRDGELTSLLAFNGTNGEAPFCKLIQGADGNFYGTTAYGGAHGLGTIFRLSLPLPPDFQEVSRTGTVLTMTWRSVAGQTYKLQRATNLTQIVWDDFGIPVTATNGTMTASDTVGPDRQRYYRVELLP